MGLFITLEGIDGAGKSTQARLLRDRLVADRQDVVLSREPGGAPGAEDIRKLLVEGEPNRWSAETEILLFTAARRDHVERTIQPALRSGKTVLCDRFVDSTRAYQGSGPLRAKVDTLHDLMIGLTPDLTLVFDLDPEVGLARAGDRGGAEDRFEQRGLAFQKQLRAAFHDLASSEARFALIDADAPEHVVADRAWRAVQSAMAAQ